MEVAMKRWMIAALLTVFCSPALSAGQIARVEVVDSASGRTLPVYSSGGRYYIAGTPGREYSVRLKNRLHEELLAVVSVDGVNVVSGETASVEQGGYILGRRQRFDIKGWRKSLDQVASFYFAHVDESYAAQTGRPQHVGVIGVALFKRKSYPIELEERSDANQAGRARSPAAPSSKARSSESGPSDFDDSTASDKLESALGTGHGRRQTSVVRYGQFERASDVPNETIIIYYDSRANLIARGVIPGHRRRPDPFPVGFVADPPNC
jgi:hypothetical protein